MKSIRRILFSTLLCYISSIATLNAQDNTYFLHTIEKGQSLYSISSMYGVSKNDIIRLNPGCDHKIYAGQALKIPQTKNVTSTEEIFHTIQPGESLYRLSVIYNVSTKAITDENPGLSAENFKAGEVVRIPSPDKRAEEEAIRKANQIQPEVKPRCKDMHKVKRKETVFSVSRKYGISEEELKKANPELKEGMKKGQLLCIPYPSSTGTKEKSTKPTVIPSDKELFKKNQDIAKKLPTIRAAIVLPLYPEADRRVESSRMVEFYEGFLLAVDSLKKKGVSIDLFVDDSGSENRSISSILNKEEMKERDIIFGPLFQPHIKEMATFAENNDTRLVIPFTSKDNEVFRNPNIYQVNTPQSYLFSEVYEHFVREFPKANVIILGGLAEDKEKGEFIAGLKAELNGKNIPVQTTSDISPEHLKSLLREDRQNIFVPTSASDLALIKLIPQLKLLVRDNLDLDIRLFGYPEWQTYTKDHLESFFELNTYFYSSFYTNNLQATAINFINNYYKWFSKEMANVYPKYGMLGFDIGYFFLSGLAKYGTGLEENLEKVNVSAIQTGFKFERVNNWGGFINKKVFFINFARNFEVIKLDFD